MEVDGFKVRCLEPLIYRYDSNGNPSLLYPCGKCALCRSQKRKQWSIRMENETAVNAIAYFVTLTYDDDNLYYQHPDCPSSLNKKHFQDFMKRLRNRIPFSVRYYAVGEYGSRSNRPHYHFIMWLPKFMPLADFRSLIGASWNFGFNTVYQANLQRIFYIAKYTVKGSSHPFGTAKPFQLVSRNPPIGYSIFERNFALLDSDFSVNSLHSVSNRSCSIPRSFEQKYKCRIGDYRARSRSWVLQKEAGKKLRKYADDFNRLSPQKFNELRDNIERRVYSQLRNNDKL